MPRSVGVGRPLELLERDPAEEREARYCEGCGTPWFSTLAERAAAGWERWCEACGDVTSYHRTPPAVWRAGRCRCAKCDVRRAFQEAAAWTPEPFTERPADLMYEDRKRGLHKRPYITVRELREAQQERAA